MNTLRAKAGFDYYDHSIVLDYSEPISYNLEYYIAGKLQHLIGLAVDIQTQCAIENEVMTILSQLINRGQLIKNNKGLWDLCGSFEVVK